MHKKISLTLVLSASMFCLPLFSAVGKAPEQPTFSLVGGYWPNRSTKFEHAIELHPKFFGLTVASTDDTGARPDLLKGAAWKELQKISSTQDIPPRVRYYGSECYRCVGRKISDQEYSEPTLTSCVIRGDEIQFIAQFNNGGERISLESCSYYVPETIRTISYMRSLLAWICSLSPNKVSGTLGGLAKEFSKEMAIDRPVFTVNIKALRKIWAAGHHDNAEDFTKECLSRSEQ